MSDYRSEAIALGNVAGLDFAEGNPRLALSQMQEALKLKRAVGNRSSIAYTLIYLGRVSTVAGDLGDARRYLEEADSLLRSIHEKSVDPPIFLAQISNAEAKPEEAEAVMTAMAPKFQKPNPRGQYLAHARRKPARTRRIGRGAPSRQLSRELGQEDAQPRRFRHSLRLDFGASGNRGKELSRGAQVLDRAAGRIAAVETRGQ